MWVVNEWPGWWDGVGLRKDGARDSLTGMKFHLEGGTEAGHDCATKLGSSEPQSHLPEMLPAVAAKAEKQNGFVRKRQHSNDPTVVKGLKKTKKRFLMLNNNI